MRDDFTEEVKRTLSNRAGSRCSNPDCFASTSGPQDDPTKAVNVGVAAHITAAAEGGPRYDSALTSEERRSIDNGIWLCQNCAHIIDSDVRRFSKELLLAWKTIAEDRARNSIGRTAAESAVGERLLPLLELYLEPLGIVPYTYEPRMPVRSLVLGLKNVGSASAKFPTIRYRQASGLRVDDFGIDGNYHFGLPRSPSDSGWETFRGGANDVIHQGETLKMTYASSLCERPHSPRGQVRELTGQSSFST